VPDAGTELFGSAATSLSAYCIYIIERGGNRAVLKTYHFERILIKMKWYTHEL